MIRFLASLENHNETILYFVPNGEEVGMITLKGDKVIKNAFPNLNKTLPLEVLAQRLADAFCLVNLDTRSGWKIPLCVMHEAGLIAGRYHYPEGLGLGEILKLYNISNEGFSNGVGEGLRKSAIEESCAMDADLSGLE